MRFRFGKCLGKWSFHGRCRDTWVHKKVHDQKKWIKIAPLRPRYWGMQSNWLWMEGRGGVRRHWKHNLCAADIRRNVLSFDLRSDYWLCGRRSLRLLWLLAVAPRHVLREKLWFQPACERISYRCRTGVRGVPCLGLGAPRAPSAGARYRLSVFALPLRWSGKRREGELGEKKKRKKEETPSNDCL